MSFTTYHVSASEALRRGGEDGLSRSERLELFVEAQRFAAKAFVAADNQFHRWLAMDQLKSAAGLRVMVLVGFASTVTTSVSPEDVDGFVL